MQFSQIFLRQQLAFLRGFKAGIYGIAVASFAGFGNFGFDSFSFGFIKIKCSAVFKRFLAVLQLSAGIAAFIKQLARRRILLIG